jgi:hypothetical protein
VKSVELTEINIQAKTETIKSEAEDLLIKYVKWKKQG